MIIIPVKVIPKKSAKSCHLITFFRIMDSGIDTVTIAVIKAKAVPKGTPLPTRASITGITLTEFAYKGEPSKVAIGTAYQDLAAKYFSTRVAGTKP